MREEEARRRRLVHWLAHLPLLALGAIALLSMTQACVGGGGDIGDGSGDIYGFYP